MRDDNVKKELYLTKVMSTRYNNSIPIFLRR